MNRKQTKKKARILIVDDHSAVREALVLRLSRQGDLEVCGEAADANAALLLLAQHQPDVAIIDLSLKTGNGIDLVKRIKDRGDPVRILVWSMHSEVFYAERVLRAGALGYICKDQAANKMVEAIQQVLQGEIWLSEEMAETMYQRAAGRLRDVGNVGVAAVG
jgi:DNA-binding NarL/FixJ family response regulator